MLLKGKVPLLVRQCKVQVLVEFVAVNRDFDSGHVTAAPHIVADFKSIGEPGVRLHVLLVDVTQTIQRTSANRIRMSAVDLGFVAVRKPRLRRRAKIQARITAVIDLYFGSITKIRVRPLRADQHRWRPRAADRSVFDFPNAFVVSNFLPSFQRRAVEQRNPLGIFGVNVCPQRQN